MSADLLYYRATVTSSGRLMSMTRSFLQSKSDLELHSLKKQSGLLIVGGIFFVCI